MFALEANRRCLSECLCCLSSFSGFFWQGEESHTATACGAAAVDRILNEYKFIWVEEYVNSMEA